MPDEDKTLEEAPAEDIAVADPQLTAALAQVEELKGHLNERDAKMGELQAEISEKGTLVESQAQELAMLHEAGKENETKLSGLAESLVDAVKRYRDLALVQLPDAVADLVVGDTVDAVDASFNAAKTLVDKVKASLETAASEIVSSGSPERTGDDWRNKSPNEQIAHGLNEQT